ncbi:hypothetical protein VNO78_05741 [Psophocarpus tetragonolobus]|uniref:Uncharacterized protein n=1 Tax=Psophocarpus tetragonolobus TaxID=3891 RepID=A0AAN9XR48_PSOTE
MNECMLVYFRTKLTLEEPFSMQTDLFAPLWWSWLEQNVGIFKGVSSLLNFYGKQLVCPAVLCSICSIFQAFREE